MSDKMREAIFRLTGLVRTTHGNVMKYGGAHLGQHFSGLNLAADELYALIAIPTTDAGEDEVVGAAIEFAWNGSGSDGKPNDLPPIELTDHERRHLGRAAIAAIRKGER